jgi:Cu(I)-responsive transcriptional regulator
VNISKVAKVTGLTAKTIRYYEQIGLITAAPRSANGYRHYTDMALQELRVIKRARATGFNLEESQALLALYRDEERPSAKVKQIAQAKIVTLRSQITTLQTMLASLEQWVSCCQGDEHPACPILDELERG